MEKTCCCICYDNVKTKKHVRCLNYHFCTSLFCTDCFTSYLEHCIKDNVFPKCVNEKCNNDFSINDYKIYLNKEKYEKFCSVYVDLLKKKYFEKIDIMTNNDNIIKKMISEKVDFLNTLPKSINFIIDIALSEKKKKIVNSNIKITNSKSLKNKCFNLLCDGYLDKDYNCNLCENRFCKKCEKLLDSNHICAQEDIESVNYIKQITKCPTCNVAVEKIDGCNFITCARCLTNFNIRTGENSGHEGNHGKSKYIADKEHDLNEYMNNNSHEIVELLDIINIKYQKIKHFDKEKYENKIVYLLNTSKNYNNIMKTNEEFKKKCLNKLKFMKYLLEIEHNKNKLSVEFVGKINEALDME